MKKKIAIIGAGIGGLAAGIRLRHAGYPVQIFEKNKLPGGKIGGKFIEGYSVDTGPTILRAPYLLNELLSSVGQDPAILGLQPVEPQYKFFTPDLQSFTIHQEINATIQSLSTLAPQDANQYTGFLHQAREHYRTTFMAAPQTLNHSKQPLTTSTNPFSGRTLFQCINTHFSNKWIQSAFAFYPLFFGQNPMFSPERISMLHALENQWGIVSPKNGMADLAQTLADIFVEMGGKISFRDEIQTFLAKRNHIHSIRVASGRLEQCDIAISNISAFQVKNQLETTNSKTNSISRSLGCSFFTINMIVDPHPDHQNLETHNIFLPKDFQNTLNQIFRKKVLPDDPWIYLHYANRKSENKTPSQPDNFFLIIPVPNNASQIDWKLNPLEFQNTILNIVEKQIPDLRKRILHEIITTPEELGSLYSLPFGTNFQPSVKTSFKNLFFVGESAWQGLGLIGALTAAEEASNIIQNL